jgi:hypothetical protein
MMINQLHNVNYCLMADFMNIKCFKKTRFVLLYATELIKCTKVEIRQAGQVIQMGRHELLKQLQIGNLNGNFR